MIAAVAGAFALAAWTYLFAARGRFWRVKDADTRDLPAVLERTDSVAAIIPARNEADHIASAVRSLAPLMAVYVADDGSTDGTGALAAAAGATEVVRCLPPPPGWTGKMWALAQGVAAAARNPHYRFYLFTDADIVHHPQSLGALVAKAEREDLHLASYMVLLEARSPAEKLLIPAFVFFFLKLYPPEWIADRRRATAGAAGGCILIRRHALQRIGGLAAIRGELIDDCALAKAVKFSGGAISLELTRLTRSTRSYADAGSIWNMIARTAFTQLDYSAAKLAATVVGMGALYLAPPALVWSRNRFAAATGAAAWLLMSALYAPMLRFYRVPLLCAPLLPAIAAFYTGATVHSALRYWRGTGGQWKGRAQAMVPAAAAHLGRRDTNGEPAT